MTIRLMREEDLGAVAALHGEVFAEFELSAKLGPRYLKKAFYREVLASGLGFVYLNEDDGVVNAFATGFIDNPAFYRRLRARNLGAFLGTAALRCLQGRITLDDLRNMLDDRVEKATRFKAHLGALALAPDLQKTVKGGRLMKQMCVTIADDLRSAGAPGIFGVTDLRNIPTQKLLERLGYTRLCEIEMAGKSVVIYELELGRA